MADMAEMEMPLPDNTLPMMSGQGPYGPVEMGGMFTMLKVRRDQKPGDYKDPGWYKQPEGTQAFEWTGVLTEPARFKSEGKQSMQLKETPKKEVEVTVKKPSAGAHSNH